MQWYDNFTTWNHFAEWATNSNWAGLLVGLVLPGAVVAVLHHRAQVRLHRETRAHHEALMKELTKRLPLSRSDEP